MVYFRNQNIIMAKKLFLNTERAIPTAEVPSFSREEPESEVLFSDGNSTLTDIVERLPFLLYLRRVNHFLNGMKSGVVC